jgi:hypothetical protein
MIETRHAWTDDAEHFIGDRAGPFGDVVSVDRLVTLASDDDGLSRFFTLITWPVAAAALTRIIHERFCCTRRSAAPTSLRSAGSPLGPSTYCTSTPQDLRPPRAALATRLGDFATNRHE